MKLRSGLRLSVAALGLGSVLTWAGQATAAERPAAELMDALMWNREPVGGPFALVDHTGQPRTDADFRGKLLVIYFGFTYCPDICPTDLHAIGLALDRLGPSAYSVQPIFITVDPERDTPEHLARYVPLFHPRLVGLSRGDPQRGARLQGLLAKAWAGRSGDYTVDYTGFIYLVGPAGQYLGFLPPGSGHDRLAQVIRGHPRRQTERRPPFICTPNAGAPIQAGAAQRS
jgi:cytochrome oxidase Cu insertion factor (SCO1/SenC/PrrC family)